MYYSADDENRRIGLTLLHFVAVTALMVLIVGYAFDQSAFRTVVPDGAVMVPITALGFAMVAGVISFCYSSSPGRRSRAEKITRIIAAVAIWIALVNLVLEVGGSQTGLHGVLFGETALDRGGSMAEFTSVCFVLVGLSGLALSVPRYAQSPLVHVPPTFGIVLAFVAFNAHVLTPEASRSVIPLADIAIHTSALFVILFLGLMLVAPRSGWVGYALNSREIRSVGITVLAFPSVLVLVATFLTNYGLNWRFAMVVCATVVTAILGSLLIASSMRQYQIQNRLSENTKRLQSALSDRDVLLAEVCHRVKNNLQQVDALVWSEAGKYIEAPGVRASFEAMSGRIRAIAAVHQQLIQRETFSDVDLESYLESLVNNIANGAALRDRNITAELHLARMNASLAAATTIGLLVNELLANSVLHAFDKTGGRLTVTLEHDANRDGFVRLVVADNGRGFDPKGTKSGTGSRLVDGLARQLQGTLTRHLDGGTRIEICFPHRNLQE